jgi:ferredoxin-type protein NapF
MERCPEGILVAGDGGFPSVDFTRGECTFCGDCTRLCEANLFDQSLDNERLGWSHKAVVSERCLTHFGVMCRSCEDACEPQAIRFPLAVGKMPRPLIDTQACTGCGACVGPCPEIAITMVSGRDLN